MSFPVITNCTPRSCSTLLDLVANVRHTKTQKLFYSASVPNTAGGLNSAGIFGWRVPALRVWGGITAPASEFLISL